MGRIQRRHHRTQALKLSTAENVSTIRRREAEGTRTAHAFRRDLELVPEREEDLRRRDVAGAQRGELVAEHGGRDRVARRVLVPVEGNRELDVRQAACLRAVEVDAHVLACAEVDGLLNMRIGISIESWEEEERGERTGRSMMSNTSKFPRSKLPLASFSAIVAFGLALRSSSVICSPPTSPSASAMCGCVNCCVLFAKKFVHPSPGHVASRTFANVKPERDPPFGRSTSAVLSPAPSEASSN